MRRAWLIIIPILLVTFGQTCSKAGALQALETGRAFNLLLALGYAMLILRGFVWVFILKTVRLSFAYPMISSTFIFVLLASWLVFGEPLTWPKALGCVCIIGGVSLVALAEQRNREKAHD